MEILNSPSECCLVVHVLRARLRVLLPSIQGTASFDGWSLSTASIEEVIRLGRAHVASSVSLLGEAVLSASFPNTLGNSLNPL